ncbi:hypothetical protein ACFQU2_05295 [Siccirubricoccus deserti]
MEAPGGGHGEVTSASLLAVWREMFPYLGLQVEGHGTLATVPALRVEHAPLAEKNPVQRSGPGYPGGDLTPGRAELLRAGRCCRGKWEFGA